MIFVQFSSKICADSNLVLFFLSAKADRLGREALDRIFGRGRWHFITLDNKLDSVVTKRLKTEEPDLPFF